MKEEQRNKGTKENTSGKNYGKKKTGTKRRKKKQGGERITSW